MRMRMGMHPFHDNYLHALSAADIGRRRPVGSWGAGSSRLPADASVSRDAAMSMDINTNTDADADDVDGGDRSISLDEVADVRRALFDSPQLAEASEEFVAGWVSATIEFDMRLFDPELYDEARG